MEKAHEKSYVVLWWRWSRVVTIIGPTDRTLDEYKNAIDDSYYRGQAVQTIEEAEAIKGQWEREIYEENQNRKNAGSIWHAVQRAV